LKRKFDIRCRIEWIRVILIEGKLAGYGCRLRIINISIPSFPVEVSFMKPGVVARGFHIIGNYAYVADWATGLRIIDISNPSAPAEVGSYSTGDDAVGVYVSGNYAYMADYYAGLRIIDISTPSTPVEVGFFDGVAYAEVVYVPCSYVYVADGASGLYIAQNDLITAISEKGKSFPANFSLEQNYPNPFNSQTIIESQIPEPGHVKVAIYNLLGQEIITLVDKNTRQVDII